MSRIAATFAQLAGRAALIPYITAGDPDAGVTVPLMHALVEGGADIIELGIPFSDPMADGPTIQLACERALLGGMSLRGALDCVRAFRAVNTHTPVVLMGYLNPIEAMGTEQFAAAAAAAGVDGVLTVDLALEETASLLPALKAQELDTIFLIAPTTTAARIAAIATQGSGYLYYVSLKGVTGSDTLDIDSVSAKVAEIRTHTALPVAVGFGIRTPEVAAQVAQVAQAVVVGSALVEIIAANPASGQIPQYVGRELARLHAAMAGVAPVRPAS